MNIKIYFMKFAADTTATLGWNDFQPNYGQLYFSSNQNYKPRITGLQWNPNAFDGFHQQAAMSS